MKNLLTLLVSVSVVAFMSGASASAQKGPGGGAGPSISQGHGGGHGADSHGADSHGPKTGTDVKGGDRGSHADWEKKFDSRMQNDPAFAKKINSLLPTGMDAKTAEMGFENRGQFIAALHVSRNLGIPFDQLKAKMTGITVGANGQTTQSKPESLGKAIHDLKPTLTADQVKDAVKKADQEASEDTEKTGSKDTD
jgi:hypothetical protein